MRPALRFAILLLLALLLTLNPAQRRASADSGTAEEYLSPYWSSAITQWSRWILYWANERELDPDLVAAVIRKESIGQAGAEGPYGSVGLMMVMPAETSGLSWRPSAAELKQPTVNLRWGTGMLKQIIRDAGGDLLAALAAYNGGWDQLDLRATEEYAQSVLSHYAHALAARHGDGYQESVVWALLIVTRVDGRIKLIQTRSSGNFVVPCIQGAIGLRVLFPDIAEAPRARVARFVDEEMRDIQIDAWAFVGSPPRPAQESYIAANPPRPAQTVRLP
jgi:hypothetical protein